MREPKLLAELRTEQPWLMGIMVDSLTGRGLTHNSPPMTSHVPPGIPNTLYFNLLQLIEVECGRKLNNLRNC